MYVCLGLEKTLLKQVLANQKANQGEIMEAHEDHTDKLVDLKESQITAGAAPVLTSPVSPSSVQLAEQALAAQAERDALDRARKQLEEQKAAFAAKYVFEEDLIKGYY